jgi:hypothetical protein
LKLFSSKLINSEREYIPYLWLINVKINSSSNLNGVRDQYFWNIYSRLRQVFIYRCLNQYIFFGLEKS